jgi:hypothetical protein
MPRIILSLIVLVLLSSAGVVIYLSLHRDRPIEVPDLTLLNESLHRTMESEIGIPPLTQNLVELTVKQQDLDSEIERIKNLAVKLGGNATINQHAGGPDQELLAEIPSAIAQRFIKAVENPANVVLEVSPNSGEKNQIIEVKLHVTK